MLHGQNENEVNVIGPRQVCDKTAIDQKFTRQARTAQFFDKFSQALAKPRPLICRLKRPEAITQFVERAIGNAFGKEAMFIERRNRHSGVLIVAYSDSGQSRSILTSSAMPGLWP